MKNTHALKNTVCGFTVSYSYLGEENTSVSIDFASPDFYGDMIYDQNGEFDTFDMFSTDHDFSISHEKAEALSKLFIQVDGEFLSLKRIISHIISEVNDQRDADIEEMEEADAAEREYAAYVSCPRLTGRV